MKQTLSLFLALILTFSLCIGLISCGNTNNSNDDNPSGNNPGSDNPSANNPSGDNPSSDNPSENNPFIVDLAGYVANIGNATALGISKKEKASASPMASYGTKNSGVQLLSFNTLASDKDTEDKNYIVMSTTDYDANAPEADETGLTKVTFTKIVTENVTTVVSGEKIIKAHKDGLSFHAIEGFVYSVYEGDTLIYEGITDNCENDKNNKIGKILLVDLTDKVDYTVKYSGLGTETTITQDDINGEIDKLYVMDNYTFISFVPIGMSERPSDDELAYPETDGATYDNTNYFSNKMRQSFVIDNSTGYVYQLKDVTIGRIRNNLIIISGKIYDIRITENDDLQFYTVVQNETLEVANYYKDIYGNKYICNPYLDAFDEENGTVYYTNAHEYLFSTAGIVIHRYCGKYGYNTTDLKKIEHNFTEVQIDITDEFYFEDGDDYGDYNVIKDGWLYLTFYYGNYRRINVTTLVEEYGQQNEPIGDHVALVNYELMVVYWKGNLYYGDVFGEKAAYPNGITNGLCVDNLVLLLEGATRTNIYSHYTSWRFRKTTLTETIFYKIIIGEDGYPKVIDETYIAPEEQTITLQPLNK